MSGRLILLLVFTLLAGCGKRATNALSAITADYRPADSQQFTADQARAVSVAKTEFEKHQGKEARYKFATHPDGYRIFIQPVLAYDHGQPLTDPNGLCSVVVTTQFTVIRFYGAL